MRTFSSQRRSSSTCLVHLSPQDLGLIPLLGRPTQQGVAEFPPVDLAGLPHPAGCSPTWPGLCTSAGSPNPAGSGRIPPSGPCWLNTPAGSPPPAGCPPWMQNWRPAAVQKVRRPVRIMTWFGEESSTEESGSEDNDTWREVDRKKNGEERRRKEKRTKKAKITECATKAGNMAGVRPISRDTVQKLMTRNVNFENVKIIALKNFLAEQLDYNEEELEQLIIRETKFATNGDTILYVAMELLEHMKELHMRKAECKNNQITIINYVPPNFFDRFMFLSKLCTEKRSTDKSLKTQL